MYFYYLAWNGLFITLYCCFIAGISPSKSIRIDGKSVLAVLRSASIPNTATMENPRHPNSQYNILIRDGSQNEARLSGSGSPMMIGNGDGDSDPFLWKGAIWWNGYKLHINAKGV